MLQSASAGNSAQNQSIDTKPDTRIDANIPATLPRGKKLVLKDGTYHLVSSYEKNGERVRYFSVERSEWEELPASLVDWDATSKAEAEVKRDSAALVEKVHKQEIASRAEAVADIDASLQVTPGVFLPPGEGMFVVEDGHVFQLEQAGSELRRDKKRLLEQMISPIPIVPGKQNVQLPGRRAKMRITAKNVEFYLREAPPDPDRVTPIQKSSRPGESGPEMELVRAVIKGGNRQLESIQILFGREKIPDRKTISVQRWEIAPTVFRFTLGATLEPGEYALAEILPDGMNLFVWDFGVDAASGAAFKK
ncbi:MAG: hypothetical protein NVS9B4_04310 [Candidatus Acidiferrum sp.]